MFRNNAIKSSITGLQQALILLIIFVIICSKKYQKIVKNAYYDVHHIVRLGSALSVAKQANILNLQ